MNLPNKLTMARMCMVPLFVAAMQLDMEKLAVALFVLASVTDFFDGHIARSRELVTEFGKLMDPIADKLLVASALICLVASGQAHPVCALLLLGREFVVSGIRMLAVGKGVLIAAGPLGKIKTVLQMVAITCVLVVRTPENPVWMLGQILLWASAVMACWSLADYVLRNKEVFTL